jgi:addiction module HigA family antidote
MVRKLNVPRTRIERIVAEETVIAPDTTLRLGKFFNTTAQFWLNFNKPTNLRPWENQWLPTLPRSRRWRLSSGLAQ